MQLKTLAFCTFLDYLVPSLRFPFHPLLVLRTSYNSLFLTIRLAVHSQMEYGSQTEHGSQNVRYYPGICSRKRNCITDTVFTFNIIFVLRCSLSTPPPLFLPPSRLPLATVVFCFVAVWFSLTLSFPRQDFCFRF